MKKTIVAMLIIISIVGGGLAVKAADYQNKSFSFCCQQGVYSTAKHVKYLKGYTYFRYISGQPAIYVNVIDYTTGNVSNKKYISDHRGYALTNGVNAGDKMYLRMTSQSRDNTIDSGVWSPDCAGSYIVK